MPLLFDIEFRQQEGTKDRLFGEPIQGITLVSLDRLRNTIYDYLYAGYEMWIRRRDQKPLTQIEIEYILREVAENMIEDGWPLGWRMLKGSLVIYQDQSVVPFGRKAQAFYKRYTDDTDVDSWSKRDKIE